MVEWPAISPDLRTFYYFLWGYLKGKVYLNHPENLVVLKVRICQEIRNIKTDVVHNIQQEFIHGQRYSQIVNGAQF